MCNNWLQQWSWLCKPDDIAGTSVVLNGALARLPVADQSGATKSSAAVVAAVRAAVRVAVGAAVGAAVRAAVGAAVRAAVVGAVVDAAVRGAVVGAVVGAAVGAAVRAAVVGAVAGSAGSITAFLLLSWCCSRKRWKHDSLGLHYTTRNDLVALHWPCCLSSCRWWSSWGGGETNKGARIRPAQLRARGREDGRR